MSWHRLKLWYHGRSYSLQKENYRQKIWWKGITFGNGLPMAWLMLALVAWSILGKLI
jgi:hypothetical protein